MYMQDATSEVAYAISRAGWGLLKYFLTFCQALACSVRLDGSMPTNVLLEIVAGFS